MAEKSVTMMIEVTRLGNVCKIVFGYPGLEFNYPSAAILLDKKDAQELSKKLKDAGF